MRKCLCCLPLTLVPPDFTSPDRTRFTYISEKGGSTCSSIEYTLFTLFHLLAIPKESHNIGCRHFTNWASHLTGCTHLRREQVTTVISYLIRRPSCHGYSSWCDQAWPILIFDETQNLLLQNKDTKESVVQRKESGRSRLTLAPGYGMWTCYQNRPSVKKKTKQRNSALWHLT